MPRFPPRGARRVQISEQHAGTATCPPTSRSPGPGGARRAVTTSGRQIAIWQEGTEGRRCADVGSEGAESVVCRREMLPAVARVTAWQEVATTRTRRQRHHSRPPTAGAGTEDGELPTHAGCGAWRPGAGSGGLGPWTAGPTDLGPDSGPREPSLRPQCPCLWDVKAWGQWCEVWCVTPVWTAR